MAHIYVTNFGKTVVDPMPPSNLEEDLKLKERDLSQKQREIRQL